MQLVLSDRPLLAIGFMKKCLEKSSKHIELRDWSVITDVITEMRPAITRRRLQQGLRAHSVKGLHLPPPPRAPDPPNQKKEITHGGVPGNCYSRRVLAA